MAPFIWGGNMNWTASYARVRTFFERLRKDEGATLPVGAAGFCWGGKLTVLLARAGPGQEVDGMPLIDAGFTGHPSQLQVPDDIDKIALPVSFAIGDRDNQISPQQAAQIKSIVEAKPAGQTGEVQIYKDCSHGFCVRADLTFLDVAEASLRAEDQCIEWFQKHFKSIA